MWVLVLSCFDILANAFSTRVIRLKYPLGTPNMADQDSITWD